MSVMVRFGRKKAFLRRGEWVCSHPALEQELNDLTNRWIQETGGPPIDDHDHELTVAEEIARRLGGRIAKHTQSSREQMAQIYIARRQLELGF